VLPEEVVAGVAVGLRQWKHEFATTEFEVVNCSISLMPISFPLVGSLAEIA
jgi:hypothetical protein